MVALLEACDVTNNARHLVFYHELQIRLKLREMVIFCASHENNHITKHVAEFLPQDLLLLLKEVKKTCIFTQNWLDHLLLMTSYLVTIATDHQ